MAQLRAWLGYLPSMARADLVVVSNRGPLAFVLEGGSVASVAPPGGLAASLRRAISDRSATWVFAAAGAADQAACEAGLMKLEGADLIPVSLDRDTYSMAYDVVANATLWPLHHHLFDLARRPVLDRRWQRAWAAFKDYSDQMAEEVSKAAASGAVVLVHDYHLCLVPGLLKKSRPDLAVSHFTHTPFADPGVFRVMPPGPAEEVLASMVAADACGFHAERWRCAFEACCADIGLDAPATYVAPLCADPRELVDRASSLPVAENGRLIEEVVGERKLILRVDRVEPSKNLLRGFWAFDELLERRADLREKVTMVALAYLSRQNLPEYAAYRAEVEQAVEQVNHRWGSSGWRPVVLDLEDNPDRSLAALMRYDVLLVNPVRDGLNLVAMEGPLVNQRDGVLVLSREAGAYSALAGGALGIDPFDTAGTSAALERSLEMPLVERKDRIRQIREVLSTMDVDGWLEAQILAATGRSGRT